MDPAFTDSKTHERKGKWSKPHKASRHDKRGPRLDIVYDEAHEVEESDAATTSAAAPPAPVLTCQTPHPSLSNLYQAHGYRGYVVYVNTEYCDVCRACKTQKATNIAWMTKHEAELEDAADVFATTQVCNQPPAPALEAIYAKSGYDGIAEWHPAYYCTDCPVCRVQHAANNRWKEINKDRLAKEAEEYQEACWRAQEEEQDRRKHYDWCYRNRRH